MAGNLTLDDVEVVASPGKPWAYTIAEVAAMTRLSRRRILDHCRSGDLDHIHAGGIRVMTEAQIAEMLAHFSTGAAKPKSAAPTDPLDEVRARSQRAARRQTPRRIS